MENSLPSMPFLRQSTRISTVLINSSYSRLYNIVWQNTSGNYGIVHTWISLKKLCYRWCSKNGDKYRYLFSSVQFIKAQHRVRWRHYSLQYRYNTLQTAQQNTILLNNAILDTKRRWLLYLVQLLRMIQNSKSWSNNVLQFTDLYSNL